MHKSFLSSEEYHQQLANLARELSEMVDLLSSDTTLKSSVDRKGYRNALRQIAMKLLDLSTKEIATHGE